ncbi:hypothetical protein EJ08DRAFT_99021, partial [Tothia fuscella]
LQSIYILFAIKRNRNLLRDNVDSILVLGTLTQEILSLTLAILGLDCPTKYEFKA